MSFYAGWARSSASSTYCFYYSDVSVFAIMAILVRTDAHMEAEALIRTEAT